MEGILKKLALLVAIATSMGGCCAISCNGRLPNSHIKVNSDIAADCTFEDKAGNRHFSAPGEVLGMPKNAPGTLTCKAKGYKPFQKTMTTQDWNLLTSLSEDPDAVRYFSEVKVIMEPYEIK